MDIGALINAGRLDEAIGALGESLRSNPANYRRRTTLFTLLCYVGNHQRAEQQLTALAQEGPSLQLGAESWRAALQAGRERERLFAEGRKPAMALGLREPEYLAPYAEVIRCTAAGDLAAATAAAQAGEALRPPCPCQLSVRAPGGGEARLDVPDLRDVDDRFGPFLELFIGDEYAWLPLSLVESLEVPRPRHLLDLLYTPVTLRTVAGPLNAIMPVLYPRTAEHADPQVRLGRMTVFGDGDELTLAAGARLFAGSDEDFPLLDLGRVRTGSEPQPDASCFATAGASGGAHGG